MVNRSTQRVYEIRNSMTRVLYSREAYVSYTFMAFGGSDLNLELDIMLWEFQEQEVVIL